jgi:hypothetical protein
MTGWAGCGTCGGALLAWERAAGVCGHCAGRGAGTALASRARLSGTDAREAIDARADLVALAERDRAELVAYTAHLRATGILPVYASQRAGRGLSGRFGARYAN